MVATAVLRAAKPLYESIIHTGINEDGKTVRAPFDGYTVTGQGGDRRFVAVHHTTSSEQNLKRKWLFDRSQAAARSGGEPTTPDGDVIKTIANVREYRKDLPDIPAILALTVAVEPNAELIVEVERVANAGRIEVDIWSRSRIAHFLDNHPDGQWIRKHYFGVVQERLSENLLRRICHDSLSEIPLSDDESVWVARGLDDEIEERSAAPILFVVAGSGTGKTVACLKRLRRHLSSGGFGIVVPDRIVENSSTVEQAIEATLRGIYPALADWSAGEAFKLCAGRGPFLMLVEDASKATKPARLIERIASWAPKAREGTGGVSSAIGASWQILCPVWPQVFGQISDQARGKVEHLALSAGPLSRKEGSKAARVRAHAQGIELSQVEADSIANALGNDALLIAVHDYSNLSSTTGVLSGFIERSIRRLSAGTGRATEGEYREALLTLAGEMLKHGVIHPKWDECRNWLSNDTHLANLRELGRDRHLLDIRSVGSTERVDFRHDRVRDCFLVEALANKMQDDSLGDDVLSEPYFAEIVGGALSLAKPSGEMLGRVQRSSPLALFFALKELQDPANEFYQLVVHHIGEWIDLVNNGAIVGWRQAWEAKIVLSQIDGGDVGRLAARFKRQTSTSRFARFRNGDLTGGLEMSLEVELGTSVKYRDQQFQHAKKRFGERYISGLNVALRRNDLSPKARSAALRLAGYLQSEANGDAILACWDSDPAPIERLADYFWAAAQCCGARPELLLERVIDGWSSLPDEKSEHNSSERSSFAVNGIRWAFQRQVPASALPYLVKRADSPELHWQITYFLHEIDHPVSLTYLAKAVADYRRKGSMTFQLIDRHGWTRRIENGGQPMSLESRTALLAIWQEPSADDELRKAAFDIWVAGGVVDLPTLQAISKEDALYSRAFSERVAKDDATAMPELKGRLLNHNEEYWWWNLASHLPSVDLAGALEGLLSSVGNLDIEDESNRVYSAAKAIRHLPKEMAEQILLRHWDKVGQNVQFFQSGIFFATPALEEKVRKSVDESKDPQNLFKHVSMNFGVHIVGEPPPDSTDAVKLLLSFSQYLDEHDIGNLWELCNTKRWFTFRRQHVDHLVTGRQRQYFSPDEMRASLDEESQSDRRFPLHHWVEHRVKADLTVDWLIHFVNEWAHTRSHRNSISTLISVVGDFGSRRHLELLSALSAELVDSHELVDAIFAVKRRGLAS